MRLFQSEAMYRGLGAFFIDQKIAKEKGIAIIELRW